MIKRESKSAILFRHFVRAHKLPEGCWLEMKDAGESDSLPFSALKEAQVNFALAIESDMGVLVRVSGATGVPDYKYARNEPSYVVIRYPKGFAMIRIGAWVEERDSSDRKSLTWDRACAIAERTI